MTRGPCQERDARARQTASLTLASLGREAFGALRDAMLSRRASKQEARSAVYGAALTLEWRGKAAIWPMKASRQPGSPAYEG